MIIISNTELERSNKLIDIINKTTIIYEKTIFFKYDGWYKAILKFGFFNLIKYDEIYIYELMNVLDIFWNR